MKLFVILAACVFVFFFVSPAAVPATAPLARATFTPLPPLATPPLRVTPAPTDIPAYPAPYPAPEESPPAPHRPTAPPPIRQHTQCPIVICRALEYRPTVN